MCEIDGCNVVISVAQIIDVVVRLVVFLVVLLVSISIHEAAHAWVSYKFGDTTAFLLGRVSLNPKRHVDPIGSLLLPIFAFFLGLVGQTAPVIGWGRPTPVNSQKWSNYRWGNFFVAIAGVVANLILIAIGIGFAKILMSQGVQPDHILNQTPELAHSSAALYLWNVLALLTSGGLWFNIFILFTGQLMLINLMLLIFNLLPIPPLDGGNIIAGVLPLRFKPYVAFAGRFGFIILLVIIGSGVLGGFIDFLTIRLKYILTSI